MTDDVSSPTTPDLLAQASPVKKGDQFAWMGTKLTVRSVARDGSYANVLVQQQGGASWTKRQPLPLPADAVRIEAAS